MIGCTIGADVEVFVFKNNKPFNLAGKIEGTKRNPKKTDFGYESWDNVSYEFAIDYTTDAVSFRNRILAGVDRAKDIAQQFGGFVRIDASAVFKQEQLDTKEALVFGCEPDFSAWSLMENVNPMVRLKDLNPGLRSCGGHIHVGAKVDHVQLVRLLDLHLGVPSVILDKDKERRKLYGRAGAHRKKPYGVEYRALSNFWIKDEFFINWVYSQVRHCVSLAANEDQWVGKEVAKNVVKCLNESDEKLAHDMIRAHYLPMPRMGYGYY